MTTDMKAQKTLRKLCLTIAFTSAAIVGLMAAEDFVISKAHETYPAFVNDEGKSCFTQPVESEGRNVTVTFCESGVLAKHRPVFAFGIAVYSLGFFGAARKLKSEPKPAP